MLSLTLTFPTLYIKMYLKIFIYILILNVSYTQSDSFILFNNSRYGAIPSEIGPIGGGDGYKLLYNRGDYVVNDLDELIMALSLSKSGDIIFVPGGIEINLTARIYIEQLILKIPSGVSLVSDRGYEGSKGALLFSDAIDTPVMILAGGPDVHISGFRIQGPNSKRYLDHHNTAYGKGGKGRSYYYKFPNSRGIKTNYSRLEVDNCDISGFSHAGIYLNKGNNHYIHHNKIHHCQYQGLGYGVCLNSASSVIEYNKFNWNRHSIAGTGVTGCSYIARHNIEEGESLGHCFDMHGGIDRKDGTDISGTDIEIYNNTFNATNLSVMIRGKPQKRISIHSNWFKTHNSIKKAVKVQSNGEIFNNYFKNGKKK